MIYKSNKTRNISFPLGGIGTGCIGLSGNGELIDWEIFNRPDKNTKNGYSHFAIKAQTSSGSITRALHGDTNENLMGRHKATNFSGFGFGPEVGSLAGFPHFRNVEFDGHFPFADLKFSDADFPAEVRLVAFNPFIPHDEYNSSLPLALFEWEIENISDEDIDFTIALSIKNPAPVSKNQRISCVGGLLFKNGGRAPCEVEYFDLCALTDAKEYTAEEYWYRGAWMDSVTTYWKNLSECKRLPERSYSESGEGDHGTLAAYISVPRGERGRVRFVLAWNAPNQYNYWNPYKDENGKDITWQNYYATQFKDSEESAKYGLSNFDSLLERTRKFDRALSESTLPDFVKDAVSANLSVLKSPTVLRYEDGSFWAWEGVNTQIGSCEGTCQHVWNYSYSLAFLFPALERSIRENTMKYALKDSGESAFRVALPLGREPWSFRACLDGQMGEVIKCFREWRMSGDTEWLASHSKEIFSMLEYAWSEENPDRWDRDMDGILEGRQHHTLDMELFGPSSWLQGFYLLALDCGAKMAEALGDTERAEKYRKIYENGKAFTNESLFGGEYFIQKTDLTDKSILHGFDAENYWNDETGEIKYQIADGCMIDQMLSDYHAALIGLDGIFEKEKKARALDSLYKYNYKPSMREVTNMWRIFAVNDEAGTVICSYPDGAYVPAIPIPYCEECMTGFEYTLGSLMVAEGKIREGESIVRAVRERYDGEKRNPWNEFECGSNYARSMASFSLLPIYSGFSYDMTRGYIGFKPPTGGESSFLFSIKNTFGSVKFESGKITLTVLGEPLSLRALGHRGEPLLIKADGKEISFESSDGVSRFEELVIQNQLEVELYA